MGFFSDLVGSFTGDAQRDELRRADKKATGQLEAGYGEARPDFDAAVSGFDTYAQSGQQSQKFYDDLLGLNGPEARAQAQAIVTSDPQFQGGLAQDSNAVLRALNAQGASGGGRAQLAGQRVLQQNYGNWMDRYRQGGEMGLNATASRGNALTNRGNFAYGHGATKAGQSINMGNAMAEARGIGLNNLLQLGGTALKAATPGASGVSAAGNILSAFR